MIVKHFPSRCAPMRYMHTHARKHIYTHTNIQVYTYVNMQHTYKYTYKYTCIHAHAHNRHTHAHAHTPVMAHQHPHKDTPRIQQTHQLLQQILLAGYRQGYRLARAHLCSLQSGVRRVDDTLLPLRLPPRLGLPPADAATEPLHGWHRAYIGDISDQPPTPCRGGKRLS